LNVAVNWVSAAEKFRTFFRMESSMGAIRDIALSLAIARARKIGNETNRDGVFGVQSRATNINAEQVDRASAKIGLEQAGGIYINKYSVSIYTAPQSRRLQGSLPPSSLKIPKFLRLDGVASASVAFLPLFQGLERHGTLNRGYSYPSRASRSGTARQISTKYPDPREAMV
jgi:hypothetical protein